MKKRIVAAVCAFTMLFASQGFVTMPQVEAAQEQAVGTTYYFSSEGDNRNDGTSAEEAWQTLDKLEGVTLQAGDQVLLEAGSVFNGFIHLRDVKGTEENPIRISSYGEGNMPIIRTNGQGIWHQYYGRTLDNAQHKGEGYVSSSILLYDTEYIEISNLELTNEAPEIDTTYNALDTMDRTGVAAVAQNGGTLDHIYLDGLYIHNVDGNVYNKHMNNGGIYFTQFVPDDEETTGIARYNDVRIENCHVEDVSRWGIAVGYTYQSHHFKDTAEIADDAIAKYGSSNVVIRNNYVKDAGGDAITTMYCDRPLIEYNVSDAVASQINSTDYSETTFGIVAAAIWPWKCKDAVFQYNEAFDTCYNQDSQAWDADYGDGTIYQYNYSHNNGGGAVMFCGVQAINNIFRYNISYHDLGGVLNPAGNPDAHIYNNTFYIKEGIDLIRTNMAGGGMVLENNIIYYDGETAKEENWNKQEGSYGYTYNNNLYYNYTTTPAEDANAITGDPIFVETTVKAPTAYKGVAPFGGAKITYDLSEFEMFKIQSTSPAVNAGIYISNNGGLDFFGNKIEGINIDIGAHQTNTDTETVQVKAYSDVYEIQDGVISGVTKTTTAAEVKANLIHDSRVTVEVYNGETAVEDATVVSNGMTVKVSYGDESVTYTIQIARIFVEYDVTGMTAEAGSVEVTNNKPASNVLDNNTSTVWHSDWNGCNREDAWISINMQEKKTISMLKYVPRTSQTNGIITEYEIYVSDDGVAWGEPVATGTWAGDNTVKYAYFPETSAQYVKLVALDSLPTTIVYASAAEIRLGYEQE